MTPVFSKSSIKYFNSVAPIGVTAPYFPSLVKALKALPQLTLENKVNHKFQECRVFLEEFQKRALNFLPKDLSDPNEISVNVQNLVSFYVQELKDKNYTVLKDLEDDLVTTFKEILNEAATPAQIKVVDLNFMLSSKEIKDLGMNEFDYYTQLGNGSIQHLCADYAFYSLKDPLIIPWLKGERTNNPLFESQKDGAIELLKKWGYEIVKEPQKGDLIAYINDCDQFTHIGVLETPDRVISKLGKLIVLSHPIEQISNAYRSNSYICFRKVGVPVQLEINSFLDQAKEMGGSFNHPSCYSPLSRTGVLLELKREIMEIVLNHKEQAGEFSPYRKAYFQTILEHMESTFDHKLFNEISSKSRVEIVQIVRQVVDQIIQKVIPHI